MSFIRFNIAFLLCTFPLCGMEFPGNSKPVIAENKQAPSQSIDYESFKKAVTQFLTDYKQHGIKQYDWPSEGEYSYAMFRYAYLIYDLEENNLPLTLNNGNLNVSEAKRILEDKITRIFESCKKHINPILIKIAQLLQAEFFDAAVNNNNKRERDEEVKQDERDPKRSKSGLPLMYLQQVPFTHFKKVIDATKDCEIPSEVPLMLQQNMYALLNAYSRDALEVAGMPNGRTILQYAIDQNCLWIVLFLTNRKISK